MRVGIDVSSVTPARTGVGNYTAHLLQHLLAETQGATFHGLATGPATLDAEALEGLATLRRVPLPTRLMYEVWNRFNRPRADLLLGGVDVFHATNYFVPPVAAARTVVTFHDLAFLRVPELCSPKILRTFRDGSQHFANRADAIIACSECTKRDMVDLLAVSPDKIQVVYEGADAAFRPVDRAQARARIERIHGIKPPFILSVGTLEPRKNVEGLLRAFGEVMDDIPHSLVLIGGFGWGRDGIDREIARLSESKRVLPLGYLQNKDDLPLFYSAADALAFPSFYEGFGLPVLEAMACGCPVICSNRGALPEVAGNAARYVDPDDAATLADALRTVLNDPALREDMAKRGLVNAEHFSWQSCARKTYDVYRLLAE